MDEIKKVLKGKNLKEIDRIKKWIVNENEMCRCMKIKRIDNVKMEKMKVRLNGGWEGIIGGRMRGNIDEE